ncbi:RNA-dependent RNA polymerase [Geopora sumneriana mitovirus 1]|uniref:RNA-dependent RNA polymerase n=1 Tax=Geopora sumneriana mitovirus 1 TaxID=2596746 RepID=A0ABX5WXU0_9VIRU|nr:RNA-dependent RNA polymerase [Geopora sumneriana mitovirus 1]QDM55307.1 RNA-dependent RNA polymerase [Geopora sumneriana mitovirus 1]
MIVNTMVQLAASRLRKGVYKGKWAARRRNSDIALLNADRMSRVSRTTSKHPFFIPKTNTKMNEEKFLQISAILRQFVIMIFGEHASPYKRILFTLFGDLDRLFSSSQSDFCIVSARLFNWFRVYALSGRDDQGDIPTDAWDAPVNSPEELTAVMYYLRNEKDKEIRIGIIRATLSILSMYKVIVVPTFPSIDSITGKFTGLDEEGSFINIHRALTALGVDWSKTPQEFKRLCRSSKFHESMSAGPNGHAVWASHIDAYILARSKPLFDSIQRLSDILGLKQVSERLLACVTTFHNSHLGGQLEENGRHSKLHVLFEKGVKCRVIAIGDYFSQCVLTPFHELLAGILKALPNDCTFDQEAGFNRVLELSKVSSELYSIDLSKATDRLPLKLQRRLMELLVGDDLIAELWAYILADRDFVTDTGHKVRYAVGQPMGFKSSFPALALLHHVIVSDAALKAGVENFRDYVILGDDIVIASEVVAKEYMSSMESLGMVLSPNKSVIPVVEGIKGAEFCSRLALNGREVTPLPVNAILQSMYNQSSIPSLWETLRKRELFVGQDIWTFMSIFLPLRDLEYLAILNALPSEISGLIRALPFSGYDEWSEGNLKAKGFSMSDFVNFYYFVLVSEAIAKIDAAVKRTANLVSILAAEPATRPEDFVHEDLRGSVAALERIVASQIKVQGEEARIHPIQDVLREIGSRVTSVLNLFTGSSVDYKSLVNSPLLGSLHFSLDQKAKYVPVPNSVFGDRWVIEKALRLLVDALTKEDKRVTTYTGSIMGVTHLWMVKVTLGDKLVVAPHVPKLSGISTGGTTRLLELKKSSALGMLKAKK